MNKTIIDISDASNDGNSGWIELGKNGEYPSRVSIMSDWSGLTGTLDGTLTISITNDPAQLKSAAIQEYTLDEAASTEYDLIDLPIRAVKVAYTANNITAGAIDCSLVAYYGDKQR